MVRFTWPHCVRFSGADYNCKMSAYTEVLDTSASSGSGNLYCQFVTGASRSPSLPLCPVATFVRNLPCALHMIRILPGASNTAPRRLALTSLDKSVCTAGSHVIGWTPVQLKCLLTGCLITFQFPLTSYLFDSSKRPFPDTFLPYCKLPCHLLPPPMSSWEQHHGQQSAGCV